ncbi:MAG: arsenite methyltransferase [Armatimonadota bacterium]|nr:arsenite methyltransferase [Armatimonadota bacterium]
MTQGPRQDTPAVGPRLPDDAIRLAVRERYARLVGRGGACCAPGPRGEAAGLRDDATAVHDGPARTAGSDRAADASGCCDAPTDGSCGETALAAPMGPAGAVEHSAALAEVARESLGCGAPVEAADLRPGEVVVDLGSGAGLDVFLAAGRVGPTGRAIGVDMTPEMIARARAHAARLAVSNAEFRLGEIEHLPLPDGSADVVISNCVINLVPDKARAFAEACRVLKPGGRLVVADIVRTGPLSPELETIDAWTACLAGAIPEGDYLEALRRAGFTEVRVVSRRPYRAAGLASVTVRATKPRLA